MKDAFVWARTIFTVGKVWVQYMLPIKLKEAKDWTLQQLKKVIR